MTSQPAYFVFKLRQNISLEGDLLLARMELEALLAGAVLLGLALAGELAVLAELTSLLVLAVFTLVNLSLVRVKRRDPLTDGFRVPMVVPLFGAVTCALFLAARLLQGW